MFRGYFVVCIVCWRVELFRLLFLVFERVLYAFGGVYDTLCYLLCL